MYALFRQFYEFNLVIFLISWLKKKHNNTKNPEDQLNKNYMDKT